MSDRLEMPLARFAWPIFAENLLRISLTSVDVLMLSSYAEKAVAAVGLCNQFVFFLQMLYLMVTIGASILISQNLGAGNRRQAGYASLGGMILVVALGIVLSAVAVVTVEPVLSLYHLESDVHRFAWQFLVIYCAGSVLVALSMVQGAILRAWGYPRDPMVVNVIANLINVAINSLVLFGWFGLPVFGVIGVACSTVFSQLVACVILALVIKARTNIDMPYRDILRIPKAIYKGILSVGVPTAGENLSYNISQILIMQMIAQMGTRPMAAYAYAVTLLRFVFMPALSIGAATQIKVGYFVGAMKHNEAFYRVFRYTALGFLLSAALACLLNLGKSFLVPLFTHDPQVIALVASVLIIAMLHEPARGVNLVVIPALKGSGDVIFPVAMGMIFMWGFGVGLSYLFGIVLGFGLSGVWVAMAMDEWARGLIMVCRWKWGAWKSKSLVGPQLEEHFA